ncbi:unnamed protein product [Pichia kudriavzevii]
MSTHKELINEFIASTDTSAQERSVDEIVKLLQDNSLTLLAFIQALQLYITSTNDDIRVSTFKLLSQILCKISSSKLYPKDIDVLMAFLYSKLLDRPVVKFVLSSIFSLVSMKFFNNENVNCVLEKLIENYNPKEHPQSIREMALKIVSHLNSSFPQSSYSNNKMIECFLHVSENEKDPSNLLLIFQILQSISKCLDITNFTQPLFDTMFRYYPISFKSSTEAQETMIYSLKNSLNTSLASNDLYAEELFPNLIEKYNTATLTQVKLDILTTISTVSQYYSESTIREHILQLWNTLKYTIMNQELAQLVSIPSILSYYEKSSNDTDQIFHSNLIAVKHLANKLDHDSKLLIYDDLSSSLLITERNRRFLQSYLTLAIISLPTENSLNEGNDDILDKTLSNLFSEEQPTDQIRSKRLVLVALSYYTSNIKFVKHLLPWRDQILALLQASLSSSGLETTLRALAIQLTVILILSPRLQDSTSGLEIGLFDEEAAILITKLGELLIENGAKDAIDSNKVIESELLLAIAKLAKCNRLEDIVNHQVLDRLLNIIGKTDYTLTQKLTLVSYLIKLSQTPSLAESVIIKLSEFLSVDNLDTATYGVPENVILQSITSLTNALSMDHDTVNLTMRLLPVLFRFALNRGAELSVYQVDYLASVSRRLIAGMKHDEAEKLVLESMTFFSGLFPRVIADFSDIQNAENFYRRFSLDEGNIKITHIPILLSMIQGLDVSIELKSRVDMVLLGKHLSMYIVNNEVLPLTRLEILVGVSVIFNKYLSLGDFDSIFGVVDGDIEELQLWALYGLIMKCDEHATEKFVRMLTTLNFRKATKAVSIIFNPIPEMQDALREKKDVDEVSFNNGLDIGPQLLLAFKKEKPSLMMVRSKNKLAVSNLTIRAIWKQKILEFILSKKDELSSTQMDYIVPLILTFVPEEMYASHLESLLPKLIQIVQTCDDNRVILSVLKIVCNVIAEENGRVFMKGYVDTVMEICLTYALQNKDFTLKKQALKTLLGMCLFKTSLVVSFKKRVTKLCEVNLDDHHRDIRMLSVSVRQAWEDLGLDGM